MEPKGSLHCLQEPAIGSYPKLHKSSSHRTPTPYFLKIQSPKHKADYSPPSFTKINVWFDTIMEILTQVWMHYFDSGYMITFVEHSSEVKVLSALTVIRSKFSLKMYLNICSCLYYFDRSAIISHLRLCGGHSSALWWQLSSSAP
jgi:hypothetical protein